MERGSMSKGFKRECVGGRGWTDVDGDDVLDPEGCDHYFLRPLLGPGREEP